MEIKKAIQTLVKALNEDEDYRYSWQANIAVAMQDEYRSIPHDKYESFGEMVHDLTNGGAKRFLNILCYQPKEDEEELPGMLKLKLVGDGTDAN